MESDQKICLDSQQAWTRLWQAGVLHSCSRAFQGNYAGALHNFWQQRFNQLKNGDRVVDIGTGNGAIPLLAIQNARYRNIHLEIHGVDLADINPPASIPDSEAMYRGIRFHSRTSALSLPFADNSVQLLTSQYAYEYMPREPAMREALRVIGKDGIAAFVMHSNDSIISETLIQQIRALKWLLEHGSLLRDTRTLLYAQLKSARPEPTDHTLVTAAGRAFEASARELMHLVQINPLAEILKKTAHQIYRIIRSPATDCIETLERIEQSLQDEYVRLQQLHNAILSPSDVDRMAGALISAGYQVDIAPVDHAPQVRMGKSIVIRKRHV